MSNHRISIDSPDAAASVSGILDLKANSAQSLERLGRFIQDIASGVRQGKVRVNVGAVQGSGTVTLASFVQDDTVTVNGVVLTGRDTPSGDAQFGIGASDQATANNLVAKINAVTTDKIAGVIAASRRATALLSAFVANDTVTVNGVVFTGKASPDAGNPREFAIGGSDAVTAENLKRAIEQAATLGLQGNALAGITVTRSTATLTLNYRGSLTAAASAHATVASTIVVITALAAGQAGNLCTLAISAHGSVSGANLTGGTEGTEYVFGQNYSAA